VNLNVWDNLWFAIQVRPRHERLTAQVLQNKGYEHFLPLYTTNGGRGKSTKVEAPLFPGYVFCKFDAKVRGPIVTTPGVIRIVGSTKGPIPVDEIELEAIRRVVRNDFNAKPWSYADIGETVVITDGPLAGVEGILVAFGNRDHVVLSLSLVQSSILIDINGSSIRPSKRGAAKFCSAPLPLAAKVFVQLS
jgi:transcription antitermination factor NusG